MGADGRRLAGNLSSGGTADEGREGHGPFRPGRCLLRRVDWETEQNVHNGDS